MKITYKTILYLLSVVVLSCQSSTEQQVVPSSKSEENTISISKTQFKLNALKLAQPDSIAFAEEIVVNGMIDVPPENRAVVNSFFEGYVSETHLLIGEEVKKGQLLIKLKHPDFVKIQQDYVESVANLEFQTAEFNRKSKLLEDKVIAQKVFQKTKNDYLSAKARASAAKTQIELMNLNPNRVSQGNFTSEISIYAPISGKISNLDVSQGKFVAQSDRIMEIVNIDHVHLELNVYEKDLAKISVGQAFQFALTESSSQRFPAHVKLIGAEIDTQNRFVKVHAHPDDEEQNYVVGMYVTSYFKVNAKTQLALPETAFAELDNKTYALKLTSETDSTYVFTKQLIQTTDPQSGYKPLLNTSQELKTTYLVKGVFDLLSGD
jgi:cobalt-zinc-cadmium efflux system membrane fusion protein